MQYDRPRLKMRSISAVTFGSVIEGYANPVCRGIHNADLVCGTCESVVAENLSPAGLTAAMPGAQPVVLRCADCGEPNILPLVVLAD